MMNLIALAAVGSALISGFSTVTPGYFRDHSDEQKTAVDDIIKNISDSGMESYRSDLISDVNSGLGVIATGIRVICALLTVLGGTGNRR